MRSYTPFTIFAVAGIAAMSLSAALAAPLAVATTPATPAPRTRTNYRALGTHNRVEEEDLLADDDLPPPYEPPYHAGSRPDSDPPAYETLNGINPLTAKPTTASQPPPMVFKTTNRATPRPPTVHRRRVKLSARDLRSQFGYERSIEELD